MKRTYITILSICLLTISSVFAASFQVLTIDPNGGTNTMPAHNLIYDVGASFVLTPPVRAGYTFAGWTGNGTEFISRNNAIEGSSSEELAFNGTSTYYDLGRTLMYTTKITINLWAYMDNWAEYGANTMRIISCTQGGGWGIEASADGDIQFSMYDATAAKYRLVTSSTLWSALSAGWHMFTMTFDGRNMYGYVDGNMHGASDIFKGDIGYNAGNAIMLGAEASDTAIPTGSYFKGKIKDVSIVKCWMNSDDVRNLYTYVSKTTGDNALVTRYYMPNGNKSLQATWKANASSTLTIDANGGTNTMSANTYSQAAGTSLSITNPTKTGSIFKHWDAATSQYISNYQGIACSSPTEVTFNGTTTYYDLGRTYMYKDKITINIWAYMDSWADYATNKNRLISCTQGGGWNWELNGTKIRAAIYDAGKGGYNSVLLEKTWASLAAGWHMFTIVFDGSRAHAYIDGVHMGQSEPFQGQIGYHAANSILLGAEASETSAPDTGVKFFKGKMKNVSIMHTAITDVDVADLYNNNGAARYYFPASATTLKAVWEGTTAPTISANTSALNFETSAGVAAANQSITVSASNLTGNITATLGGTNTSAFSLSPTSLGTTGGTITVSYKETAIGSHTATVTLSAAGATNQVITLKGTVKATTTEPEPEPEIPGSSGAMSASNTNVTLIAEKGKTPAPYVDVEVTCTGLTSTISVNPSTSAVTVTKLEGWNEQTGGTLRITLNTAKDIGTYTGYVAAQSGAAVNRVEINVTATITEVDNGTVTPEPEPEVPSTPTFDFSATPTLEKVWETTNVLTNTDETRYGAGFNNKVYAIDAANKILYSWDSEGCQKTQVATNIGGGLSCVFDETGHLLTNTSKWGTSATSWQIYDVVNSTLKDLTVSIPSTVTMANNSYVYANVSAAGDLSSDATIYMAPAVQNKVIKVVTKDGAEASSTVVATNSAGNFTNEDALTLRDVAYESLTDESFIWRVRNGTTSYISSGSVKNYTISEHPHTGIATFKLNNIEYAVVPSGTTYGDGFSVVTLSDGAVVGSRSTQHVGTKVYASFSVEKVSEGKVNIYFYKAGDSAGLYTFSYPATSSSGSVTDVENSAANTLFDHYIAEKTLFITGVEAVQIYLYNISGQRVCTVENQNQVSVENLKGIYVLRVQDNLGKVHIGKIIIR